MKGCVCDGRSEGPTKAVLSTRKLVQVEVEVTRRSLKVALTPQVGPIRSLPLIFCVLEAQEQSLARISKVSCSQQPFLLRSRQQRFFSRREGEKSKKRKRPLATSLWGGGPNVLLYPKLRVPHRDLRSSVSLIRHRLYPCRGPSPTYVGLKNLRL